MGLPIAIAVVTGNMDHPANEPHFLDQVNPSREAMLHPYPQLLTRLATLKKCNRGSYADVARKWLRHAGGK